MENFDVVVNEVLTHVQSLLDNNSKIDDETLLSLYYIKEHLQDKTLSQENVFHAKKLIITFKQKDFMSIGYDIKLLLFYYLLSVISDNKNEELYKKEFFSVYIVFENFGSLMEKQDFIKLVFPDVDDYISGLCIAFEKIDFWGLVTVDKQKIIYKLFYLTILFYERSVEPFKKLFNTLLTIYQKALENKDMEILFFVYTPLQFSWNGVASTPEELSYFQETVERTFEGFIKDSVIDKFQLEPNNKEIDTSKPIRVAFLQERLINYSIFKVLFSLLKNLSTYSNNKFEFVVLDLSFTELGGSEALIQDEIKKLGYEVVDCHKLIMNNNSSIYPVSEKSLVLRQFIIDNEFDILIGMHSRPEFNFLFTTRTCPIQIYWSHGNFAYNLDNIDKKMCHYKEQNQTEEYQTFSIQMDEAFLNPFVEKEKIYAIKGALPQGSIVLGTIGRLSKVNSKEYLDTVVTIMKQNPETVFLMCGGGNSVPIKQYLEDKGVLERVYFPGQINPHIYGHVIDIFLDSWPHRNGTSIDEIQAKARTFVSHGEYLTKQDSTYWKDALADIGIKKNYAIAKDTKEYIEHVNDLIKDPELRLKLGKCYQYHRVELAMERNAEQNATNFYALLESSK